MPEDPGGEKTLPPSPRKRQKARDEGNVAKSQDLNAAWMLLVGLLAIHVAGPSTMRVLTEGMQRFFGDMEALLVEPHTAQSLAVEALTYAGRAAIPFMLVMLCAGLVVNVAQVGILFSVQAVRPRFGKLNPITGFKKFTSVRSLVELTKSVLKLAIVGYLVWAVFRYRWKTLLQFMFLSPVDLTAAVGALLVSVWWRIILAIIILGILDYAFQRWQHTRELMMTVQEAKEEAKEFEGDPRIKRRIRQIQRQMAMQRMMADVPTADVIITNPVTYAVALRYDAAEMAAPVVVAKGARLVAKRIREMAVEHSVPIVEKPELARMLFRTVEVGQSVPEDLFRAVAEVLAFVYRIDRREEKIRERGGMTNAVPQAT